MNPWRPYPLLRLLIPFLAGLILGIHRPFLFPVYPLFYLLALGAFLCLVFVSKHLYWYGFRWLTGLGIIIFFLFLGYGQGRSEIISKSKSAVVPPDGWYLMEIIDPPVHRRASAKVIVAVYSLHKNGNWTRFQSSFILQVNNRISDKSLLYGDYLLAHVSLQEIRNTSNPFSFDYAAYLARRGIFYQAWIADNEWMKVNIPASGFFRSASFYLRDRLLDIFRNNHMEGREFAVAAALLLGYVDEVDSGLKKAYSATGAMHILSVSGMHVGVIYLFIEFLLGFMNRKKILRMLKTILVVLLIWFYAFLTGLSPAVLRAATMLSFIIAGKALNRTPEIFNILAGSVFFILILDPLIILDIGFQLSYLAVAGICLFYKPVYDWIITSRWWWDKIWSVLAVSLVAQLATFPVSLYFFHQFPNYFLLTNLFVVPLSSLIIYFGVIALIFGTVPLVSVFFTKALWFLVWLLNYFILGIEKLPFSTSRGIFLTFPEMLMMYMIIGIAYIFFMKKGRRAVYALLLCMILLEISFLTRKIDSLTKHKITIYNLKKMAAYEFSGHRKAGLFYDFNELDGFAPRLERALESIKPAWDEAGVQNHCLYWLGSGGMVHFHDPFDGRWRKNSTFFLFETKRLGILKEKIPKSTNGIIHLDYLIISGNPSIMLKEVMKVFKVREIVFDATNSLTKINCWLEEGHKLGLHCHAVTRDGAFVREF